MTDLNEVRKYLMRAAKEASMRANDNRNQIGQLAAEADRYDREAQSLSDASRAIEQAITPAVAYTGEVPKFNARAAEGVLSSIGGAMLGQRSGFVPVPRPPEVAPWERDQPEQEGPARG